MKKIFVLMFALLLGFLGLHSQPLFNKIYCSYSVVGDSVSMGFFGGVTKDTTIMLSGLTLDHTDTSRLPNYRFASFVMAVNQDGVLERLSILKKSFSLAFDLRQDNLFIERDQSVRVFGNTVGFPLNFLSNFQLSASLDSVSSSDLAIDLDTNYYYRYSGFTASPVVRARHGFTMAARKWPRNTSTPIYQILDRARVLFYDSLGHFLRYGPEYGTSTIYGDEPYALINLPNDELLLLKGPDNELLRLDSVGNVLWRRSYPGQFNFYKVRRSPDGHYVLAGEKYYWDASVRADIYEPYLVKVHFQTGAVLWDNLHTDAVGWNVYDGSYKDLTIDNQGYIYACYSYDTLTGFNGLVSHFLKFSPSGQLIWSKQLTRLNNNGYSNVHELNKIMPLPNGQFLLAGTITKGNVIQYGWLVKVDSMGQVMTITGNTEAQKTPEAMLRASPNPSSGGMVVFDYAVPEQVAGELEIWVHDVSGRQVARLRLPEGGSGSAYWNTEGLTAGTYLYTLQLQGKVLTQGKLTIIP